MLNLENNIFEGENQSDYLQCDAHRNFGRTILFLQITSDFLIFCSEQNNYHKKKTNSKIFWKIAIK